SGPRLGEEAVIETEGPLPPLADGPPEAATVESESRTALTVRLNSRGDGLLLLADAAYPGWRATVDGLPAGILRADHLFRAVAVPDGAHAVRFTFEPVSVKLGAGISALAVLGAGGGLTWLLRRRPWLPPEPAHKPERWSRRGRWLRWGLVGA